MLFAVAVGINRGICGVTWLMSWYRRRMQTQMTTLATSTVRVATSLTSMAVVTRSWGLTLLLRIQDLIWSGGQGGGEDHCEAGEGY